MEKDLTILAIETSCDETAAAVVRNGRRGKAGAVVHGPGKADGGDVVADFGARTHGFLGYDVDGSPDGRSPEQGGTAPSDDFDPVDHGRGDLLQSIDSGKGGENRAGIDENLRIMAAETVDPGLREPAVLAVVFNPDTGLERQAVRQGRRYSRDENPAVQHVDKGRRFLSGAVVPGRRHDRLLN